MDGFITWSALAEFVSFVAIVFMVVEFTKEWRFLKNFPTKYWSAFVAFVLLILVNLQNGNFAFWDIILYILSAISISLGSNGLANFNKPKN